MAARPRKNNVKIPNLYPLYSRKVNKIYWRYKHPVTGKFHSLGTNEAEATAIAIEANERLAEQRTRQVLAISDKIATSKGKAITTNTWLDRYWNIQDERLENGDIKPEAKAEVMNDLRAHFRPEFLNRLDETILFKPLTKNNIGSIIDLLVADINKRLADKELVVALSDTAKQFIVDNGYDPVYGARPLKRYLQKNVETLAARLILSDGVHTGDTIRIDVVDGKLNASAERGTKE